MRQVRLPQNLINFFVGLLCGFAVISLILGIVFTIIII